MIIAKKNLVRVLLTATLATIFTIPTQSYAGGTKISLYGKNSAIARTGAKFTAHVTPAKPGVGVTLRLGSTNIRTAKTDANGNAVFTLKLNSDAKLSARLTSKTSVKSAVLSVSVFYNSRLVVDWPSYTISCTNESIDAYVSPAASGRKVMLQYFSSGSWKNEDTAITNSQGYVNLDLGNNSNTTSAGDTLNVNERIVVAAKGRYLTVSDSQILEFEGCGGGSSSGSTGNISGSHSGDGIVGGEESFTWDVTDTDSSLWADENAAVSIDVCDMDSDYCYASDESLPYIYEDGVAIYSDDSGTFSWYPDYSGNFLVRVSLWDNGTMIDYTYGEYYIG